MARIASILSADRQTGRQEMRDAAVNYGATIIWHIARMSDENQLRPRQVDQARADFAALKSEDIEAVYARFGVPPPAHLNRTALGLSLLRGDTGDPPRMVPGAAPQRQNVGLYGTYARGLFAMGAASSLQKR